jgi:hypothetical protein
MDKNMLVLPSARWQVMKWLVLMLALTGCIRKPDVTDDLLTRRFNDTYASWVAKVRQMPPYSTIERYTGLKEYQDLVSMGREAIPLVKEKLLEDEEPSIFLTDLVITVMGWNERELSRDDLRLKRRQVLLRLDPSLR